MSRWRVHAILLAGIALISAGLLAPGLAHGQASLACTMSAPPCFTAWGTGGAGTGEFDAPRGIAVDQNGKVYVADSANHRIQVFSNTGAFLTSFGTQGMGAGQLETPMGVAVDNPKVQADDPNIYVADPGNNRVQKFSPTGVFLQDFGAFSGPAGIQVDATGQVFVVDAVDDILVKFAPDGTLLNVYGKPGGGPGSGPGEFSDPLDVDIDPQGDSWIADQANARIQELNPLGAFLLQSTASADPVGIHHALELMLPATLLDRIWVTDRTNNTFLKLDVTGALVQTLGAPGTAVGEFMSPYGIAADCDSNIFVVDAGNNRVQRYGDVAQQPPCTPPTNTVSPELAGTAEV